MKNNQAQKSARTFTVLRLKRKEKRIQKKHLFVLERLR